MSPELLRNQSKDKKTLKDYDPRSVDVWASGVLLLVSLCGAFPWDHTRQHDNFNNDQELDLWAYHLPPFFSRQAGERAIEIA